MFNFRKETTGREKEKNTVKIKTIKECKFRSLKWILINCETIFWRRDISFVFAAKSSETEDLRAAKKKLDILRIWKNNWRTRFFKSSEKWWRIQMRKFLKLIRARCCIALRERESIGTPGKLLIYCHLLNFSYFPTDSRSTLRSAMSQFHPIWIYQHHSHSCFIYPSSTQINDTFKCSRQSFSPDYISNFNDEKKLLFETIFLIVPKIQFHSFISWSILAKFVETCNLILNNRKSRTFFSQCEKKVKFEWWCFYWTILGWTLKLCYSQINFNFFFNCRYLFQF